MDHNDQSRHQYNYSAEAEQQQQQQQRRSSQFQNPVTPNRVAPPAFPQQQQQHQLSSGQSIARAGPENAQLYAFAQGLQYGASQQYGQEFVAGDSARSQHQLTQYASDLAYGMQQAHNQSDRQPSYGHDQRFRSRDGTTLETLPGQFVEPQAAQYYAGAQPGPSTATQAGFGSSHLVSHYQPATYSPAGPAVATSSFPGAMIDPTHQSAYQAFGQQQHPPHAPQLGHHLHQSQIEQAFARYQSNIRTIFTLVRNQSLQETAQLLLDASRYLLGSVEVLGLTRDQEGEHDNRINLWDEYNRAWLTTMQCQFDMTQELFAGRSLHASQSTLDHDTLDGLARELLRLCDGIEKHGLVDYQMGVAEDEIIDIILRCLSQLETMSDDADDTEVMEQ
ncbi:hypothetical protein AMS68_001683 [Peltaster fructicola]|uniref:Transcription factor domain-containing protein n=1 Tax=Peltaster fructicola TaxID=286661 RepID=A0A6H0XN86_9PEZI|nr:hypothetical protein AMS68_001683 [Peltaster fructicola]